MSFTYRFSFVIKIVKQSYNKNLYKFCEYYKDIIFAITYEVKKKTYEIIFGTNDTDFKEIRLKASEILEDLKCNKDYYSRYVSNIRFKELKENIYIHKLSYNNPKMYLYYNETIGKFKIEYTPLFIFDILYKFKKSDMDEIICWHMLFFNCLTNKDYERFIIWCIIRYWDDKYKFINIHKMNGMCCKNKRIPKDIKKYTSYISYDKELDDFEDFYKYIMIGKIPNVFNITSFMRKLEKEADDKDYYDEFIIDDYEQMIEEIKEKKEMEKIEKKVLKTIRENQKIEIVEYDLDYDLNILFSIDKEDSIIENNIFDNEKEDEEYFEIMRSRRIKKSFMINN